MICKKFQKVVVAFIFIICVFFYILLMSFVFIFDHIRDIEYVEIKEYFTLLLLEMDSLEAERPVEKCEIVI